MKVNISAADLADIIRRDAGEELDALIVQGLDPKSWFDADPHTALTSVAAMGGSVGCLDVLLRHGGDWAIGTSYDEDLETPLEIAASCSSEEVLGVFLKHPIVDKYALDWLADAVLALAERKNVGENAVALLERSFSRFDEKTRMSFDAAFLKDLLGKIKQRPDLQARVSALIPTGRLLSKKETNALFSKIEALAACGHSSRVFAVLEDLPAELQVRGAGFALVCAARRGNWKFADQLLARGADCTVALGDGSTALMYASFHNNLAYIRKFLDRGADLTARQKGKSGETALEMAQAPVVIRYLEKRMGSRRG